jgi:twitching motility two-component system response regulator PilG
MVDRDKHNNLGDNKPSIVVIDDSPTIRKAISLTLSRVGLTAVGAASGVSGLAAIVEHRPAAIFLDIVLQRLNGYQVCQIIKQHPISRSTPVIMLSGRDGVFDKVRGRLAGADDYITKPFEPEALLRTIARYLPIVGPAPLGSHAVSCSSDAAVVPTSRDISGETMVGDAADQDTQMASAGKEPYDATGQDPSCR